MRWPVQVNAHLVRPERALLLGVKWDVVRWDDDAELVLWLHLVVGSVALGIVRAGRKG